MNKINWYGEKRKGIEKTCKHCKCVFYTRKGKRSESRQFCSCQCFSKFKQINSVVEVKCNNCGIKVQKSKSSLKNSKHGVYFCSRKCKEFTQSLKGKGLGIRPSHYGTGIGREEVVKFFQSNKQYGCKCGEKRLYLLQVHHIDGNSSNNVVSNFEIVCGNCHIKRHLTLINGEWRYWTKVLTPRDMLDKL